MKSARVQPLDLSKGPKRARSTTTITEAASRDTRGLIIAALHLVFVSIRVCLTVTQLPTRRRPCGGPAIMIMHPVNSGVGVPGMGGMEGVPGITGTDDTSFPATIVRRSNAQLFHRA